MTREIKRNHWRCQIADSQDGTSTVVEFGAMWDPEKVPNEEIARACAAEQSIIVHSKRKQFIGVSAELIGGGSTR